MCSRSWFALFFGGLGCIGGMFSFSVPRAIHHCIDQTGTMDVIFVYQYDEWSDSLSEGSEDGGVCVERAAVSAISRNLD